LWNKAAGDIKSEKEKAEMNFWINAGNRYERGFGGNNRKQGRKKINHQKKISHP